MLQYFEETKISQILQIGSYFHRMLEFQMKYMCFDESQIVRCSENRMEVPGKKIIQINNML